MLETFTAQTFSSNIGDTFQLLLDGMEPIEMKLISVEEINPPAAASGKAEPLGRKPFSLLFRHAQRHQYLPQRIYHLEHQQFGAMDIFLVPLGPDAEGMRYEAVFT
jgi:hypothetical protein